MRHGGSGFAYQQGFDDALFATDAARLQGDDPTRDGFGVVGLLLHVVQAHACFQCRQMLGHGDQPAIDHVGRFVAAHRRHRQTCQPQVMQLRVVLQRGFQIGACFVVAAQALPSHQQHLQCGAVARQLG
ncbi:hypothetical protein D3C71_1140950 [compost metagenome]